MKDTFIFDFDGTLMDSMYIWNMVDYAFLKSKGIPDDEIPDNLSEIFKPKSLWEAAEYFIEEFRLSMQPEQVCNEINDLTESEYRYKVVPKEGVLEFLEKHKDKRMCIATATDSYLVEYALERNHMEHYFDFIITSSDVGNSKREPDIFLQAAERLGSPIKNCVVFEDSFYALQTAKKAGFYVVGLEEKGNQSDEERMKKTADCFVSNLMDFHL